MEKSKPFSIQAPEQIAKDYAGNKQKIAEAMRMGVVDPTAGILAGMFIDRMRSAQMQEMAQQPTVAQQVMGGAPAQAPLAQAGGLGATAPAGPPMAPAAPPMDAGLPAAAPPMNAMPPMDAMPPMGAPPMGMAEGGIAALPVSDAMFDEPEEDSYAPGGIVAFAEGGMWGGSLMEAVPGAFEEAEEFYTKYIPTPKNEGLKMLEAQAREDASPEAMKKRARQDKWGMLAEIGFNLAASKSPYLLQAAGAAAAAALPGARQAKKEREADKRQAIRDLAAAEDITYKQAMDKANYIRGIAKDRLDIKNTDLGRAFDQQKTVFQEKQQTGRTAMQIEGSKAVAGINARSYQDYGKKQDAQLERQASIKAPELARADAAEDIRYRTAMAKGDKVTAQNIIKEYTRFYRGQLGVAPYLEGDVGRDANGKKMIFKNGAWVYTG